MKKGKGLYPNQHCLGKGFNPQPAKASGTIYIRADGSVEPDTAPISSADNVTYTFIDNINESIVVERDSIVIDGAGYTVQGTGAWGSKGIDLSGRNNVTIRNMEIRAFWAGIWLDYSSNNVISGNNITNNQHYGMQLRQSSNNNLSGNNVTANNFFSILLYESFDNSISGNSITNNRYGVYIGFSSNNSLSENIMNSNRPNLFVEGDELGHFVHSIDVSNLVDGKPVYYLLDQKDLVINPVTHPQVGYLGLINCANVTVEGLTLTNNGQVLLLVYTNNSRITNNRIANNYHAVELWYSSNNNISGNIIIANEWWSIMVRGSVNNRIFENNISANFHGGIQLGQSSNNYVSGNNITDNHMGLAIYSSYNNSISRNNITDNYFGVMLSSSSDNKFYHNNFENNTQQVYFSTPAYANFWDDGYPSGGNYWSDYEERYPDAEELDGSGIWNTPYVIDENNQDNYSLMNPWPPAPPEIVATADIIPNTLNLKSKGKWITAHIELSDDYNVSAIDRAIVMLNNTIPVDTFWLDKPFESVIGDHDDDGITDLMVKFDRQAVIEYLKTKGITDAEVTLAITGEANGMPFEVTDTIKVIGQ
jgi:parallel beta-helix repeat protein